MNTRFTPWLLAVGAFALTVSLTWHHHAGEQTRAPLRVAAQATAPEAAAVPIALAATGNLERPPTGGASATGAPGPVATGSPEESASGAGEDRSSTQRGEIEVPVTLRARSGGAAAATAILINRSADLLHLSVIARDSATGRESRVAMALDAHESRDLADAGLVIEPGDQILVQAPPYREVRLR